MKTIKNILLMATVVSSLSYSTVIEDAEDGTTNGWIASAGATVSNIYDADADSKVIKLSSTNYKYYKMKNLDVSAKKIKWDMKADAGFIAYVYTMTTDGVRLFYYSISNRNKGVTGSGIHHGLPESIVDGEWHTIDRDLEAELHEFEPNNDILKITTFRIRSINDVFVDNIIANGNPDAPPVITLHGNSTETIECNEDYTEHGADAVDDVDGDVDVDITGTVDTSTNGVYTITYTAIDSAGNSATETRIVTVQGCPNTNCLVIEDAEDGTTNGWTKSSGATVSNTVDDDTGSKVIKLSSSSYKYYKMDNLNRSAKKIKWDIKADAGFIAYVYVTTTSGTRLLYYSISNRDMGETPSGIHHGLPESIVDGEWHTIERDLEADLKEFEPNNDIITIKSFKIRATGDVFFDNLAVCDGVADEPLVKINDFNDPNVNTEHNVHAVGIDTSEGTLKLVLDGGSGDTTFPFIWVANSGEGTISLLSTETGDELGRYRTGPTAGGNPSRTTVDQEGNVWVGNRNGNTITKVGLKEWDQCIDRNGNGVIDTSTGGTDVKSWTGSFGDGQGFSNAEDECILQHVTLSKDGFSANAVRLVAIDPDNNVFAGGYNSNPIFKVNGATGAIINAVPSLQNHYGGVVDKNGNLWSMLSGSGKVQKISNDMSSQELISIGHSGYGITIDKYGKVWTTQLTGTSFSTFNPLNPVGTLQVFNQVDHSGAQGIASDANGDIFIAGNLWGNTVGQYRQTFDVDGNFTGVEFVKNHTVQSGPTGVAVDATGKVWASNRNSNSVSRIDPITEIVEHFPVGSSPYNYSDMTGNVVRTITKKQGTWEATFNSEEDDYSWSKVNWRLKEALSSETTIKLFAKVANDEIALAGQLYVEIQSGVAFNLSGRYLKIKVELASDNLTDTPEMVEIELF